MVHGYGTTISIFFDKMKPLRPESESPFNVRLASKFARNAIMSKKKIIICKIQIGYHQKQNLILISNPLKKVSKF